MGGSLSGDTGAVAPVIGVLMMVMVAVIVTGVAAGFLLSSDSPIQPVAPQIQVSGSVVDGEYVAVTHNGGDSVRAEQLYVTGSTDLDIGGAPGSSGLSADYASSREAFTESASGSPQVGVGDTWDAGETVYFAPDGGVEGVTVRVHWTAKPVEGYNPGTPRGADSYTIAEITVGG